MQQSFSLVITYTRSISTSRESQDKVALVLTANRMQFTSRPGIAQCTNALRVAGCDYLSLLRKILCLWYKIVCSAFTVINCDCDVKPHLHGRLFCNAIRRFFMRENLSRKAVTHTRQDSLAAIAFGKNRCRVSNTCDLRCRLYFCATRCNNRSRP